MAPASWAGSPAPFPRLTDIPRTAPGLLAPPGDGAREQAARGSVGEGVVVQLTRAPPFPILTGDLNAQHIRQGELPRSDTELLWKRLAGPGARGLPAGRGGGMNLVPVNGVALAALDTNSLLVPLAPPR